MTNRCGAWAVGLMVGCALFSGCVPAPNPVEFSPAGDRLVFPWGADGLLHEVRADGTGLHALPGTEDGFGPRWSPDGESLAFEQEGGLVLYNVAQQRTIQRIEHGLAPVAWSPDGQRLGVSRNSGEGIEVSWYRMPELRGSRPIPLPIQRVSAAQTPRWLESRDGVAFMAANGDAYNVYTVEGEDVYRITGTGDVLGFGLAADGEHLVWARGNAQVKDSGLTLWSYDLRRRSVRKLPFHAAVSTPVERRSGDAPVVSEVQFSPGAERLALVIARPRQGMEVRSCALDGSQLKLVEQTPFYRRRQKAGEMPYDSLSPCWSHEGQRLAVVRTGRQAGIRIYGRDGGAGIRLPLPVPRTPRGG